MFNRGKKPEPEPEPEPENTDIKDVKRWITDIADPKFKELNRREQANRDSITLVNSRCADLNNDTRNLWKEKDAEKQARDQEIANLHTIIRQMKGELDKKADKPKPAKSTKA